MSSGWKLRTDCDTCGANNFERTLYRRTATGFDGELLYVDEMEVLICLECDAPHQASEITRVAGESLLASPAEAKIAHEYDEDERRYSLRAAFELARADTLELAEELRAGHD